jgi:hypothetical protein
MRARRRIEHRLKTWIIRVDMLRAMVELQPLPGAPRGQPSPDPAPLVKDNGLDAPVGKQGNRFWR